MTQAQIQKVTKTKPTDSLLGNNGSSIRNGFFFITEHRASMVFWKIQALHYWQLPWRALYLDMNACRAGHNLVQTKKTKYFLILVSIFRYDRSISTFCFNNFAIRFIFWLYIIFSLNKKMNFIWYIYNWMYKSNPKNPIQMSAH